MDSARSRLVSLVSRLVMFSRLLPGCLTPACRRRKHNYICQAACPGCPLFPGCQAAQCSLFSRLLLSRLFTRHYPLGSRCLVAIAGSVTVPFEDEYQYDYEGPHEWTAEKPVQAWGEFDESKMKRVYGKVVYAN